MKSLSCVRLFATPWTIAYQTPPSIGFSSQEYWSGLLFPSQPRDRTRVSRIVGRRFTLWATREVQSDANMCAMARTSITRPLISNPNICPILLSSKKRPQPALLCLKEKVKVKSLSHVRLFATPWTVAYQASPSMGFSRQEYWSGLPFPSPGDLPDPGIEPGSSTW